MLSKCFHSVLPLFLSVAVLLTACGSSTADISSVIEATSTPAASVVRQTPEFHDSCYHEELAEEIPGGGIDLSALAQGYVAVSVENESRLKFQIIQGESTYNYDLPGDGTPAVYPLNMGEGSYTFRVMENVVDDRYTELWSKSVDVAMEDEFQPFLRPSQMVNYSTDSICVSLAVQLAENCSDDLAVASAIYDYLVENIGYDYEKAKTVEKGYLPDPDETLSTKTGICYDYAALTAAMLRSQGIPCQLITGYVGEDALYHAWNRIYIEGQGWLTVEIKVTGDTWKRVDVTFASTGTSTDTLENDGNYTTRYTY